MSSTTSTNTVNTVNTTNTVNTVNTVNTTNTVNTVSRAEIRITNSNPESGVSLCIPRVFNNISYTRIFEVFKNVGLGRVMRVDKVAVPDKNYSRAFVHFTPSGWARTNYASNVLEKLIEGDHLEIVYEEGKPWFWKVFLSTSPRPSEAPRPNKTGGATVTIIEKK